MSFKVAFVASQGIYILSSTLTIEVQLWFQIFYFNLYYNFLDKNEKFDLKPPSSQIVWHISLTRLIISVIIDFIAYHN